MVDGFPNTNESSNKERIPDKKPDWWRENEKLKQEFGLPAYKPPRFADGTYTYEVVTELENRFNCIIRFIGVDIGKNEKWQIRVDGDPIVRVGRRRDDQGNTIYEIDADDFFELVKTELLND